MSDIFENACLIQLRTSCWTGTKQLNDAAMSRMGDIDPQWLKGKKHLVDPDYLAPVKACIYQARKVLVSQALPFPLSSLTLVPKESIMTVEQTLQQAKLDFLDQVETFIAFYERAMQEAQSSLGEHYSSLDYPLDISAKFRMDWRFVSLSVPGRASVLPAQLYEAEKAKFLTLMEESRELAIVSLREEFAEIVTHLVEKLSVQGDEKPKIIRHTMFDRFQEFWATFANRNIFQDEELAKLVTQARASMAGLDAQTVKTNGSLKQRLANEMGILKTRIDAALVDMPRRHIRFASVPEPNISADIAA